MVLLPTRVSREVGFGEQLATTELVGFAFPVSVAGISTFLVSSPIAGVIDVLEVFWSVPVSDNAQTSVAFQLAVGNSVPADNTEMNALGQVFPRASDTLSGSRGTWVVVGDNANGSFRGRFRLSMKGELLVARHVSGLTAGAGAYLGVVFERVEAVAEVPAPKRARSGVR